MFQAETPWNIAVAQSRVEALYPPAHVVNVMKSWQVSPGALIVHPPSRSVRPISEAPAGGGVAVASAPVCGALSAARPEAPPASVLPSGGGSVVPVTVPDGAAISG